MKVNPKISAAVAAILTAPTTAIVLAAPSDLTAPADQATAESGGGLAEVVVTAQRRTENIQDVPITIQAITGDSAQPAERDQLRRPDQVHAERDLQRQRSGHGQHLHARPRRHRLRQPVAVDDRRRSPTWRSTSTTSRCSSRRVTTTSTWSTWSASRSSKARKGTLFGGGAQAGAIRYITNKPKLNAT